MTFRQSNVYRNARPKLTIESTGGRSLGNCYVVQYFKITSRSRLHIDQINALRIAGFLGSGLEFNVISECSGAEQEAGEDDIRCVTIDTNTNEIIADPAINPYSNEPYLAKKEPYFVYMCEARTDSSD